MLKKKFHLSLAIALLISISACTPRQSSTEGASPSSQQDPLKLLYWQAPTILNPHLSTGFKDAEASRITLEPLASFDNNGELVLFLAAEVPTRENGGLSADGKSVTWKLKQGIKWSDGELFTAKDVVFTYQFLANPDVAATSAGIYEIIERVEAIDDYTVKISFKQVNPAWFLVFVGTGGAILPRHKFEPYNNAKAREAPSNLLPVGTGPYRVVEFKPGDTVIYEPNPNFREANNLYFQRIELKGGGDATSAARAILQTGDADFAYNIQVEAPVLKQIESAGKGEIAVNFGALMERIAFNLTDPNAAGEPSSLKNPHPFFTEKQVREAFSLAIDRDTIATQLYGATGKPTANFIVSPEQYVSPNTSYEFNLEKAANLLDRAGWKDTNGNGTRDKNGVEMQIVFQTSVNPLRQKTQEIIKQSLESIGVGVDLKSIDPSVYFSGDPANPDTLERFQADLQMFTTGNTSPDPGAYMQSYTCNQIPQKENNWSGYNVTRYCNPEYDALWQKTTTELDPEKRQQLLIQMNDLLVKDFIVIPLVARAETPAVSKRLKGINLTPWDLNTWNIQDWTR